MGRYSIPVWQMCLEAVRQLGENQVAALYKFLEVLGSKFGSRFLKAVLFGSRARGEGEEFSDIDVVVVIQGLTNPEQQQIFDLSYEVNFEHDCSLSAIVYDEEKFEREKGWPFLKNVAKDGILVYGEEGWDTSMTEDISVLVKRQLELSAEALEDAKLMWERSRLRTTANRAYYSMFYAAQALLALRGLGFSKHSGVISMFHREFVHEDLMSAKSGQALENAFKLRLVADYEAATAPEKEQVRETLRNAEEFIKEPKGVITAELQKGRK